jgi:hypothetical protein
VTLREEIPGATEYYQIGIIRHAVMDEALEF